MDLASRTSAKWASMALSEIPRRYAGRVLQLVEEVAGLLDTYSVASLKLTAANEVAAYGARSEENSLRACCFDKAPSAHTNRRADRSRFCQRSYSLCEDRLCAEFISYLIQFLIRIRVSQKTNL